MDSLKLIVGEGRKEIQLFRNESQVVVVVLVLVCGVVCVCV